MSMENLDDTNNDEVRSRRNFLKTAGTVAVTAPAVSLLMSVPSTAVAVPVDKYGCIVFDDTSTPNCNEPF
jgi:hypothetical protein